LKDQYQTREDVDESDWMNLKHVREVKLNESSRQKHEIWIENLDFLISNKIRLSKMET